MSERKPTVPEVLPMVKELYKRHGVGCCLHVCIDDGNVEDRSVQFCLDFAKQKGCTDCILLAETLLKMSKTQRMKLHQLT
jgi:hypothetical protein